MRISICRWAMFCLSVIVVGSASLMSVEDASAGLGASTIVGAPYINGPAGIRTYQIAINAEQATAQVEMMCWNLAGALTLERDYTVPPFSKKVFRDNELPIDIGFCWHRRLDTGGQLAVSFALGQPGAGGVLGAVGTRFGTIGSGAVGYITGGPGGFGDGTFLWENTVNSGRPVVATSFFFGYNPSPDSTSVDVNQCNEAGTECLQHTFTLAPWAGKVFEFQRLADGSVGGAGDITTFSTGRGGLAAWIFHADLLNSQLGATEVEADDDTFKTFRAIFTF